MEENRNILKPEDYLEPDCVLCGKPEEIKQIPQRRIIEKMNEYMDRRDYAGAERHLLYWLEEAKMDRDKGGELMIRNELAGHYRKTGQKEEALTSVAEALRLLSEAGLEGTVSAGTTYTNCATALNAFGEDERSLELFEKAKAVYESRRGTDPSLLGGLYNNMGLTCTALGRYEEAYRLFDKALATMKEVENSAPELAITKLNIATALEKQYGMEEAEGRIFALLDEAYDLLKQEGIPHDGYYAFVLEKCAPAFSYYGYFAAGDELKQAAEEIYARP